MGTAAGSGGLERRVLPLSQPLLDLFWDLAQLDRTKQLEATSKLLTALHETAPTSAIALENDAKGSVSESLKYTLERLVKGLASNRGGVRYGYAATLTLVLQEFPQIHNDMVLAAVEEHLQVEDMKTDCRTAGVGRLFAYKALITAQRTSIMSAKHFRRIVEGLCALETRKSYLKAGASDVLIEIVEKVSSDTFENHLLPLLTEHVTKSFESMTLDDLLLILRAFQYHRKSMEPLLKQTLGVSDLLSVSKIESVCTLLYRTDTRNVHPCVLAVVTAYQSHPDRFPAFWTQFVQVAAGEAPLRAKLPFDVACKLFPFITEADTLMPILSQSFLVLLLRYAEQPRAAESEGLKVLHTSANDTKSQVLKALRTLNDDKLTKSVLDELMAPEVLSQPLKKWVEFVRSIVFRLESESCVVIVKKLMKHLEKHPIRHTQLHIVRLLGSILNEKVKTAEDVRTFEKLIQFFAENAFSKTDSEEKPATSASINKELISFLTRIPNDMTKPPRKKLEAVAGTEGILMKIAALEIIVQGSGYVTSDGDEIDQQLKQKALQLAKKADKLAINDTFKSVVKLLALFAGGHWLIYRPVLAREVVEELSKMEKLLRKDVSDGEALLVLMRFLISMLTVERSVFDTFELVFHALCPFITGEAMELLLEMVNPPADGEDEDIAEGSVDFVSTDEEEEDFSDIDEGNEDPEGLAADRAALQQVPGIAQEDAEESEPDLDDNAMFELDAVLVNILRARRSEKPQEETDPRVRALRLIVIYATFPNADPAILLSLIGPVMAVALEKPPSTKSSQREQHNLLVHFATRILTAMKQHKVKEVDSVDVKRKDLGKILEECVAEAGKVHNPNVHKAFVEGILFVQRMLVNKFLKDLEHVERDKVVKKIYSSVVKDFTQTRRGEFSHGLIRSVLLGLGEHATSLIPEMLKIVTDFDATYAVMRQSQLLGIVQQMLSQTTPEVEELKTWLTAFGKSVVRLLREETIKKRKLVEDVLDFVRFVLQWRKKVEKRGVVVGAMGALWDLVGMKKACEEMLGREEMKKSEMNAVRKKVELVQKAVEAEIGMGSKGSETMVVEEEEGANEEEESSEMEE